MNKEQKSSQSDSATPEAKDVDLATAQPSEAAALSDATDLDDFYQKLQPEMRRPKPSPDAIAAALEVVQRLAAEADAEQGGSVVAQEIVAHEANSHTSGRLCGVCGYQNRGTNKFCGMCGQPVDSTDAPRNVRHTARPDAKAEAGELSSDEEEENIPQFPKFIPRQSPNGSRAQAPDPAESGPAGTHHYHHHYHHHYFPEGQEGVAPRATANTNPAREVEKILRPSPVLRGESMSRAEAAVRRVTQEWVLACNTKQLDNLLDIYVADAMVLRSNHPAVRGAAAVREFFFAALDAGLGEVEIEPLRVEVIGNTAYEAGRCKALVPGAGKRREERGKYLWILTKESSGEWKLAADCWSSDLTLAGAEAEPKAAASKPIPMRKNS